MHSERLTLGDDGQGTDEIQEKERVWKLHAKKIDAMTKLEVDAEVEMAHDEKSHKWKAATTLLGT